MGNQFDIRADQPDSGIAKAVLSEAVLERFDQAAQISCIPDELFDARASVELTAKLEALVEVVRRADVDEVASRQGWRHRLFGADVEARLQFTLARKHCEEALCKAKDAARSTAQRIQQLEALLPIAQADQTRLDALDATVTALRASLTPPQTNTERDLRSRFDRRLTNLTSLRASNALALAQIPVALAHQRQALERFIDVEMVLFPIWQRHCLAVIESRGGEAELKAVRSAARAMVDRLMIQLEQPR